MSPFLAKDFWHWAKSERERERLSFNMEKVNREHYFKGLTIWVKIRLIFGNEEVKKGEFNQDKSYGGRSEWSSLDYILLFVSYWQKITL